MTVDVFESPALPLLLALADRGIRVELTPHRLIVEPASRLTTEQRAAVYTYARDLAVLVRCCDAGVRERRDVFRQQLAATVPPYVPGFMFLAGVPYVRGHCFSCGDALSTPKFSRCWRCSLAWRLAWRMKVPADLAAALDSARVA